MDQQQLLDVLRAIADLPPRCREVFVLYRFKSLSQAQIAEQLGISRNMVERHVMRAMRSCRAVMDTDA
ncbi:ECF sigma factor [Oceanococcus atlanticus]|uniref:ECF sigma factor n=1 Tax=Oceanococcus atlanticus TaxID=1317117 RepID=A0A1Y1SF45_9GAMM|nr:ECF sigma factor [Oceanococcus atlanticus]